MFTCRLKYTPDHCLSIDSGIKPDQGLPINSSINPDQCLSIGSSINPDHNLPNLSIKPDHFYL